MTEEAHGCMFFDCICATQEECRLDLWRPFKDQSEWELVKWLVKNVGKSGIEEFTNLSIVHKKMDLSFSSTYKLIKATDKLLQASPWRLKLITIIGDLMETDGKQLEEELMANPDFMKMVSYEPQQVFADATRNLWQYDEMWTGDWWWELQGQLPKGAVIAPVILASDKISLSLFQGDQEVWPVYLMTGNISKEVCHQPSKHMSILLGYLPTTKLKCYSHKYWALECYWLFQYCMAQLLEPLILAGKKGILMTYLPEQCLIACCKECWCPKCKSVPHAHCHQEDCITDCKLDHLGLHAFPHSNIFIAITPNILHQLHKDVFKDHIISWITEIVGTDQLDECLKHFKKGISHHKQWTGSDHNELQRVFLAVIAGVVEHHVLEAVFIDLGICIDFNIPKVHSMMHYAASVQLFGKLPEQLHINYAKKAYSASNK
ncbi:hypothetical protein J3A83DRAFT_4359099 [Scleroderma citrinum]